MSLVPLCKCGCDRTVGEAQKGRKWNDYIHGHNMKNKPSHRKGLMGIYSQETLEQMSKSHKAYIRTEEHQRNLTKALKGRKMPKQMIEKQRKRLTGRKLSDSHIRNALRRRIPSSLESLMLCIIEQNHLPYKYVGDGSFLIAGYNPDFVNNNGKKIAVEVFCRFFKNLDGRNLEDWKAKRVKVFGEYGWTVIFFDETQVKEDFVLEKLGGD